MKFLLSLLTLLALGGNAFADGQAVDTEATIHSSEHFVLQRNQCGGCGYGWFVGGIPQDLEDQVVTTARGTGVPGGQEAVTLTLPLLPVGHYNLTASYGRRWEGYPLQIDRISLTVVR